MRRTSLLALLALSSAPAFAGTPTELALEDDLL